MQHQEARRQPAGQHGKIITGIHEKMQSLRKCSFCLKWSQEIGQVAKVYPEPLEGYEIAKRRKFTDQFKAKVALEALRGDKTIQETAARHQVHPNQVSAWKRQAVDGMADVFARGRALLQNSSRKGFTSGIHALRRAA
ncbi:transposase [Palleronia rufa]|uniref:transposase n=1 Tax=Palleronia rufa TaxID=1530186 RepID=UPI0013774615|nr:transposase [Palleronia rufa]